MKRLIKGWSAPLPSKTTLSFVEVLLCLMTECIKMYREVALAPSDKDLHRFIWRATPEQPVQDNRMTRVTFGVSASPYLAVRTLQQTAADHGAEHPIASSHILKSFYVDDLLAGANTVEEAVELFHSLRAVLKQGGFNLCKWRSSSLSVLQSIPEDLQEKIPVQEVTNHSHSSHPKALGLEWNSHLDVMSPSIYLADTPNITKRGIVSDVSKTFDVLGWISPSVLSMKMLYQKLWHLGIDWDETVPPDLTAQHTQWKEQLPLLTQKQLPRSYFRLDAPCMTTELHGFSDASEKAFGAVVYIRSTYEHHSPVVALVTRVVKPKTMTIPRMELCGALILANLLTTVRKALDISQDHIHGWTDSSIVLSWLDGHPRDFDVFVSNRVTSILQITSRDMCLLYRTRQLCIQRNDASRAPGP